MEVGRMTINLGARVKVIGLLTRHRGRIGKYIGRRGGGVFCYLVIFEDGDLWPFRKSELELL